MNFSRAIPTLTLKFSKIGKFYPIIKTQRILRPNSMNSMNSMSSINHKIYLTSVKKVFFLFKHNKILKILIAD